MWEKIFIYIMHSFLSSFYLNYFLLFSCSINIHNEEIYNGYKGNNHLLIQCLFSEWQY